MDGLIWYTLFDLTLLIHSSYNSLITQILISCKNPNSVLRIEEIRSTLFFVLVEVEQESVSKDSSSI